MCFRLAPKSMTLDDLEFKLSSNFLGIFALLRIFGRQQRLNECRLSATELLRTESTFQRCIDYVDIAGRSSARICRALTFALARLSCLFG